MTFRVDVPPQLLRWARERSGIDEATWTARFPQYDKWLAGDPAPTFKQLNDFARRTYTPIGYFFLEEPPDETLPISDFRTIGDRPISQMVSANLLDTLYRCQSRQEWYRENQILNDESPLAFVGSATIATPPKQVADEMRELLNWGRDSRKRLSSWSAALALLRDNAEAIGVLVMISGIVGSNTHRKLDPEMFRGFALSDPYAPLVFVNSADSKTAQIFTLAHELAHIWLGSSALSDMDPESTRNFGVERWCNQVAAEFLVPMDEFAAVYKRQVDIREQLQPLAKHFRVSTQVILGRIREIGVMTWEEFMSELEYERRRIAQSPSKQSLGGNYHNTKPVQVSKRFARELIASTLEGRTLYTEAFYLLEVRKTSTLHSLGKKLGVL
ncbi:ImmA/IrrE family metallo-endopeptidase [Candidatus Poriferisocius sp.]|uniref:ImmA/IrrE family metallo-endopeptidase n=1 Tax=Candidatus Poriferisocius sp. TaxID=3101276 RepID=UPI003B0173F7